MLFRMRLLFFPFKFSSDSQLYIVFPVFFLSGKSDVIYSLLLDACTRRDFQRVRETLTYQRRNMGGPLCKDIVIINDCENETENNEVFRVGALPFGQFPLCQLPSTSLIGIIVSQQSSLPYNMSYINFHCGFSFMYFVS